MRPCPRFGTRTTWSSSGGERGFLVRKRREVSFSGQGPFRKQGVRTGQRGACQRGHPVAFAPCPRMSTTNRPIHEIRLGALKASIWRNETENGPRFNTTLVRIYRDGEQWKTTDSFGRDELLLLAKLADLSHTWIYAQGRDAQPGPAPFGPTAGTGAQGNGPMAGPVAGSGGPRSAGGGGGNSRGR